MSSPLHEAPTSHHQSALDAPVSTSLRVLLDTDTFNEVDDQFALAHLLLSPDRISLEAVTAAPFLNNRSTSAGHGMELSYEEIHRVLERIAPEVVPPVFRGSTQFMGKSGKPVPSDAVDAIIELGRAGTEPLYVAAIGAPTNVASALLLAPDLVERIIVIWLGAHGHDWPKQNEFNYFQDIPSSEILFTSGVPLIQIPCHPVASHLLTTPAELERYLRGYGAAPEFLLERVLDYGKGKFAWSKVIWDVAASAWLVNPDWLASKVVRTSVPGDPFPVGDGPVFRQVYSVNRDAIFADLFQKLQSLKKD